MGAGDGCSTESICPEPTFGAWRKRLLPRIAASLLLLLAGVWWGLAVVAWIGWEKRFASAGLRAARAGTTKKKRDWASTIVDVIQFGLPTVLAVGLAIDGLGSGIVFYGYPGLSSLRSRRSSNFSVHFCCSSDYPCSRQAHI